MNASLSVLSPRPSGRGPQGRGALHFGDWRYRSHALGKNAGFEQLKVLHRRGGVERARGLHGGGYPDA